MTEKIGNVTLCLDDYPGEDLYSDGAVEDTLLEIAKDTAPSAYEKTALALGSWPVMYHFSPMRGNIISWYPLRGKHVLEIGAGCGAVTGAIATEAASVTCVELSKKRSMINAYRNRDLKNITIRVGNFETVREHLPQKYDLITLIGVFEYGRDYISGKDPYVTFLAMLKELLAPGGEILIAIENRIGLKYFAGCTEDHTGVFYDGIEGYRNTDHVRTFSKKEIERLIRAAGFPEPEFYYPYPDYKFPKAIYSDAYLPRIGELRSNIVNYDRARIVNFDEAKAYDALIEDGMFPEFSNSFLIRLGGGEHTAAVHGKEEDPA